MFFLLLYILGIRYILEDIFYYSCYNKEVNKGVERGSKEGDMKRKNKIKIRWSKEMAYAIGLLATDGNLSSDGRHFDFTSKDLEQINNFMKCLGLWNKIGRKKSGSSDKLYFRVQFGSVKFYQFLLKIGLGPAKSKNIGELDIPDKYFFDFLRGEFDGDGCFYSYFDPRWKSSFMFYIVFISASYEHIKWLRKKLNQFLGLKGHITNDKERITYQLKYAKKESVKILKKIYIKKGDIFLKRKYLKVIKALAIIGVKI